MMRRLWVPIRWFLIEILFLFASLHAKELTQPSLQTPQPVHIGVLAYRPKAQVLEAYRPLETYLNEKLPHYTFHIDVLNYQEIDDYVKEKRGDFLFTNSGNYILLKERYGLSSPLCTLAVLEQGQRVTHFGGVIFTRADSSIQTIEDLKHTTVALPHMESLGAYQMQAFELSQHGISTTKDLTMFPTGMPHDKVVRAVLEKQADAGFVRTGVLEKMVQEGKLNLDDIRVIHDQNYLPSFPVKVSTKLYPEWPLVALPHVDEKLSRALLATLFLIPEDSLVTRSMGIYGFNIPQDYTSIEHLLRALRFPPFDDLPRFNLQDIWLKYTLELSGLFVFLASGVVFVFLYLIYLNRMIRHNYKKEKALSNRLMKFAQIIEQAPISIVVTNMDSIITYVNQRFSQITGYSKSECIGSRPNILKSGKMTPEVYRSLWQRLKSGEIWEGELINTTKDHREYVEWETIAPLRNDEGDITNYVGMKEDITERKKDQEVIRKLAFFDQLTSLPNRQKLNIDFQTNPPTAVMIVNIDAFKEINDFFGLEAGDALLKQVARWLEEQDFRAYRTGGDEFTILVYDNTLTIKSLEHRMELLHTSLEAKVFQLGVEDVTLRMSVGAAIGKENLMTHADIALHLAKEKKLNSYLYTETENLEEHYRKNINMAAQVRKAILQGRILCYYQPIVDAKTGETTKYEALVRMIDEEGKIVLPSEFLSIAQKMKLYSRITYEVVYQSCMLFKNAQVEFSINLSVHDIEDAHSVESIVRIIAQTQTAHRIVFEILESEGIENYENVQKFIDKVKTLGAKIAIDDFGTGYSNFAHILQMNIDYLKIDGSLIQGLLENRRNETLVEAIVTFAHRLGIKTIAEYVSDERILAKVTELGVDFVQGFYLGRPSALSVLD